VNPDVVSKYRSTVDQPFATPVYVASCVRYEGIAA
jgi:hypothetical protein